MPNNWKTYKLDELCVKITDGAHASPKQDLNGEKMIATVKDMTDYGFKLDQCKRISDDDFQKLESSGCVPNKGDVLFSKDGTIGKVLHYSSEFRLGLLSSIAIFKPNKEFVESSFLAFYLKDKTINRFISENFRSGSAIPRIILRDFKKFELTIPPLPEQKAIASILSAIDDKIENNLAINKTLEEMAMALYKHWFVDFGPFQNGEFIDSELGKIPKGWEVKRLDDLAHILNSKRVPLSTGQRSQRKGKYPYYGASGIIDNIDDFIFDGEHVIISEDGENLRSRKTPIGFSAVGKFWVNNHAHILKGKQNGVNRLIICHIAQMDMNPYLTGAVQPKLNKSNLLSIDIAIPKEDSIIQETLIEFHSISRLVFSNESENQSLTELRDTLLPKLISGEVRLQEFQEKVNNVISGNEVSVE